MMMPSRVRTVRKMLAFSARSHFHRFRDIGDAGGAAVEILAEAERSPGIGNGPLYRVGQYLSVADFDQPVGAFGHLAGMGDDDDRMALRVHGAQQFHHVLAALAVERAGRFVGKDDASAIHQRAGDGNALLLAAGKLVRAVVEPVAQLQRIEQFGGARLAFGCGQARVDRRHFDIFLRRRGGDEIVALEDEAESAAAQRGKRIGIERRNILAVEQILPAARTVETAQNIHQRRLAGAGSAHDGDEFARFDVERNAVQHLHGKIAIVVGLADIGEPDKRRVLHGGTHQNSRIRGLRPLWPAAASEALEALVTTT